MKASIMRFAARLTVLGVLAFGSTPVTDALAHGQEIIVKANVSGVTIYIKDLITGQTLDFDVPTTGNVWGDFDWWADTNEIGDNNASHFMLQDRPYQIWFKVGVTTVGQFTYIQCAPQSGYANDSEYPDYCPVGMDDWTGQGMSNQDDVYFEVTSTSVKTWGDGYNGQYFNTLKPSGWTVPFDIPGFHYYLKPSLITPTRGLFTAPKMLGYRVGVASYTPGETATATTFCTTNGFSSRLTHSINSFPVSSVFSYPLSATDWEVTGGSNKQYVSIRCGGTFSGGVAGKTSGAAPAETPLSFALHNSFPNPFNPTTSIPFDLPEEAHVRLQVYDALGRLVRTLVDGVMPAGSHATLFDAVDLPSGVYLYRLEAGSRVQTKLMTLMK